MTIGLIVIGYLALLAPGFTRDRLDLHPADTSRVFAASMAGGSALIQGTLVLWATPTVFRFLGYEAIAEACSQMLGPIPPGGQIGGWVAFVAAIGTTIGVVVGSMRSGHVQSLARVERSIGTPRRFGSSEITIVPTQAVLAYAIGGRRPQIVVSQGLIDQLPPVSVRAIAAHEQAHVRHRHHRFVFLSAAVTGGFGWLPGVRTSLVRLHMAVESWADEEAAGPSAKQRSAVRRALLAMLALRAGRTETNGSPHVGSISERLQALAGNAPTPPRLSARTVYALTSFPILVAAMTAGWSAHGIGAALFGVGWCCHP